MSAMIEVVSNLLPGMAARFDGQLQRAFDDGVATCIAVADPLTRVDTGDLKANKEITRGSDFREVHWIQDYAAYQNFGTRFMSGTNFAGAGAEAGFARFQAGVANLGLG